MSDQSPVPEPLESWIGRSTSGRDRIGAWPIAALSASLDRDDPDPVPGTPVPPLWHWLYFLEALPLAETGRDGHPRRGGFLPPVPLPRRMWAGSRLWFPALLRVGDEAERRSTITKVQAKQGRSGDLVFVTVRHEVFANGMLAVVDEHDIVYRDDPRPGQDQPSADPVFLSADPAWHREVRAGPVLLFRYSALTFNGHRIHYDQPYATEVEGYPGLVVHGPLLATLMLDLVRRQQPEAIVTRFSFRALAPVFETETFHIVGAPEAKSVTLWVSRQDGRVAMTGVADLAP